jgi:hypothetical protein
VGEKSNGCCRSDKEDGKKRERGEEEENSHTVP